MVIDKQSQRIICTHIDKGRKHDFRLFKESRIGVCKQTKILVDSGYQGIQKRYDNTLKPIKGTRKRPLTKEDKLHNHQVGSQRVVVEHIIRCLKIFKIVAYPYRNKRKRFALRINIIAAIYNLNLC